MRGSFVISAFKRRFRLTTDRALAERLGVTVQAIQNWKNRKNVTPRQLAGLVQSAGKRWRSPFPSQRNPAPCGILSS
jgi:transcriptional regulator with XRE-family HTH domain